MQISTRVQNWQWSDTNVKAKFLPLWFWQRNPINLLHLQTHLDDTPLLKATPAKPIWSALQRLLDDRFRLYAFPVSIETTERRILPVHVRACVITNCVGYSSSKNRRSKSTPTRQQGHPIRENKETEIFPRVVRTTQNLTWQTR